MTLAAPLQAWGGPAVTTALRPTDAVPTLSGVTGLIANALGRERREPLKDLLAVMHVRVDRPGTRIRDFHTVGTGAKGRHGDGVPKAESLDADNRRKGKIVPSPNPITGDRWYLSDAAFTVVWIPASAGTSAESIATALERPARPLYLGRRSCPPGYPVLLGITDSSPEMVFSRVPLLSDPPEPEDGDGYFGDVASAAAEAAKSADDSDDSGNDTSSTRLPISVQWQMDTPQPGASARSDVPVTFDPSSRWHYHHSRWTVTESRDMSEAGCVGRGRKAHLARREALSRLNAEQVPVHTTT